jgi:hypothetical protein
MTTDITRERLDAIVDASGLTSLEHDLAAALLRVLDLADTNPHISEHWATISAHDIYTALGRKS